MNNAAKLLLVVPMTFTKPYNRPIYVFDGEDTRSISSIISKSKLDGYFSYSKTLYTPYETSDSITVSGTCKYTGSYKLNNCYTAYQIYSNAYLSGSAPYKSSYSNKITITNGYEYNYSIAIPNVSYYLSQGIKVIVGIYSDDYSDFLYPQTISLNAKTHKTINPLDYRNKYLEFNNSCWSDGQIEKERFLFNNFQDFIDSNVYYKLDISNYSFEYSFARNFTYKSAKLIILDTNNLFTSLPKDNNGNRYIPLTVTNDYHLAFPKQMYVDKGTLMMSLEYRPGLTQTKHFFLPRGKRKQMQEYEMSLEILDCGSNGINIVCPITYSSEHELIGGYGSGLFHVIGGLLS